MQHAVQASSATIGSDKPSGMFPPRFATTQVASSNEPKRTSAQAFAQGVSGPTTMQLRTLPKPEKMSLQLSESMSSGRLPMNTTVEGGTAALSGSC